MEIPGSGNPAGEPFDWYQRALELLNEGNPDAAATLLERIRITEPSAAVLEALGRALFESRRYDEAIEVLTELVEREPDSDYAHYALGLALWRRQVFPAARDHLAMAFVMRPDRAEYGQALGQVKATLRARKEAGLALEGPIDGQTT